MIIDVKKFGLELKKPKIMNTSLLRESLKEYSNSLVIVLNMCVGNILLNNIAFN